MHTHFRRIANCQINRILMKGQTLPVVIAKFCVYYFLASSRLFKWNTVLCILVLVKTLYFDSSVFYERGYNPKAFSRNICSRLKFYVQDHISLLRHNMYIAQKRWIIAISKILKPLIVALCAFIVVLTYCRSISEYYMELWSRKSHISCNVGIMGGLIHHLA